jgi:hypothetical protein
MGEIDELVLTGGMTRMPRVIERMRAMLGKRPHQRMHPEEAVALGAAIQGGIFKGEIRDVLLLDATPITLSIASVTEVAAPPPPPPRAPGSGAETPPPPADAFRSGLADSAKRNRDGIATPMIARNTTIPTRKSQLFTTCDDGQTAATIVVLQGERPMAKDNLEVGVFRLDAIAPALSGVPQIEVTLDLDANSILHAIAKDLGTGREEKITLSGTGGLSREEVERLAQRVERRSAEEKARKHLANLRYEAEGLLHRARELLRLGLRTSVAEETDLKEIMDRLEFDMADGAAAEIEALVRELARRLAIAMEAPPMPPPRRQAPPREPEPPRRAPERGGRRENNPARTTHSMTDAEAQAILARSMANPGERAFRSPEAAGRKRSRLALPENFRLGRYRIGSQLGAGAFGITYLAQDLDLQRPVAIKELLPTNIAARFTDGEVGAHTESDEDDWAWAQRRFFDEAQAIAACEHPNVLHVYEIFAAQGTVYMVTRYEKGCDLEAWLKGMERPPGEAELSALLWQLLAGLGAVHRGGFLHRDIKPGNIYMTDRGRPLLIDFGSARQKITHKSLDLTRVVTPGYAPFEQYVEDSHQGPFTDLYAVGAVMYRAITGKRPPDAPTRQLSKRNDACLRLAQEYRGQFRLEFLESIDEALANEAADRPPTAQAWRQRLWA